MYETTIMKQFEKMPLFSLGDINQIIKNRVYAKKFLSKMVKENKIFRIKKDAYTLHNDSLIISSFLVMPSYITGVSALAYYKLITQIPNEIFCATSRINKSFNVKNKIYYMHTNYFFGFKKEEYLGFKILIAEPEKAIIDSISITPLSVIEEAIIEIDKEKMISLLLRIKKSSIVKRIGYMMEVAGFDVYPKLKKLINYRYIPLEPLLSSKGEKNKKWKIIVNTK